MTTAPVMTITEELLQELEEKAQAAIDENELYAVRGETAQYDPVLGLTGVETVFAISANPATMLALVEHLRSQAAQLQALRTWRRADDELPEPGVTVLACYINSHGKARRIRAEYVAPKSRETIEMCDSDEQAVEYDEETDTHYWQAGWYERLDNWCDYSHLVVSEGEVTHWMPLPAAPAIAQEGQSHE